jgi:hypothetical protein
VSVIALARGTTTEAVGTPADIQGHDSTATIAAVNLFTSDAQHRQGVRMSLKNADHEQDLIIDASEATLLREEFASFDKWQEPALQCEAISLCVQGVARCSPSQSVRQAVCPSTYSTPEGERGVLISTAHSSFRFPSTQASTFVDALDAAIREIR